MSKKVKYRGRWFDVISESETEVVIESYGTNRTVLKDEVVYEEPVVYKDIVEEPKLKETEILVAKEDQLPSEMPPSNDLIQKEEPKQIEETVPQVGIDMSTETSEQRHEQNAEVVNSSIIEDTMTKNVEMFKEKMRKLFA